MTIDNEQQEIFNNILAITRDQLAKTMSVSTELEALLMVERQKVAKLEAKIEELEQKLIKSSNSK